MKRNIEVFKNNILFNEVHRTEQYDKIREYIETAERYIRMNKEGTYNNRTWTVVLEEPMIITVFEMISGKILHHKNLLVLLDELKAIEFETNWAVSFNYEYYKSIFKNRIKDARAILEKLRPYILEETKHYSLERKKKDLDSDIGEFFKGWYTRINH